MWLAKTKPEWITAIGTLVLIWFEVDRKWPVDGHQAHWSEVVSVLVVFGLVVVSILNFISALRKNRLPTKVAAPPSVPTPRLDALARKHGIYIGSSGIAAQVIGDTLTVRLTVFTCTILELRYMRVALNTGMGEVILESAEPHRIGPFMEFDKTFTKTLTADETRRTPNWASTVTINGKAKFENQIEKDFSFGSALSRPALHP
jgi:hypothetical protein